MNKLKKYSKYKNLNNKYLPTIPEHWLFDKYKTLFIQRKQKNHDPNALLLSLFTHIGVRPRSQMEEKGNKAVTVIDYSIVKKEDLIVNKLLAWMGAIAKSNYNGVTSPDYDVYELINKDFNSTYFHYLCRSKYFIGECYRYGRGIMMMRHRTYPQQLKNIYIPIPPIDEQDKIVSFIEYKEKQINKLIKKQKKLIELLEEKKKIIITEAVTKGLDKSVPMKDSGIDYIGQIPQNWEIKKIKQILKQISKKKIYRGGIYIGMENIESWTGRFNVILNANIEGVSNIFSKGQILFGKLRPYLAKCIITDCAGLCSSELLVLKPNKDHDENFIQKLMLSKTLIDLVDASTYGAKMPRANWNFIKNIECAIPDINEQREIIKYINKIDEFINKLIQNKKILIEKLEDYKKNLISFAVTGQIDVRDYEIPKIDDDIDLENIENISEDDTETISEVEYANN